MWCVTGEGSRMTSSFLALVTEWQVVPFMDTDKMREDQDKNNVKMGIKSSNLNMLILKFFWDMQVEISSRHLVIKLDNKLEKKFEMEMQIEESPI